MIYLTLTLIAIFATLLADKMLLTGAAKKDLIPVRVRTRRRYNRSDR